MTAPTDTFAAFVDALSRALDDHETTAEDLARCVHLSRFHFDRVFAATAGESPGAFRPAACRLLDTSTMNDLRATVADLMATSVGPAR